MLEPTEVIAEFATEAEAHMALARLREEGIDGEVKGYDVANSATYSLYGQMAFSAIQVAVPASRAEEAREVLNRDVAGELEEGWEEAAESAIDGWICVTCDTPVSDEDDICPECGSSRSDQGDAEEDE